jgi:DNA-binding response OmpR family regulator
MADRILVVDSDKAFAQGIAVSLQRFGYTPNLAYSKVSGLKMARTGEYAAILTEVHLPDGSGLEIPRTLRGIGHAAPVVALTAHAEDAAPSLKWDVNYFLTKPPDILLLIAVIEMLIRDRKFFVRFQEPRLHEVGGLALETEQRLVRTTCRQGSLTETEVKILKLLMSRAPAPVSRYQLIDEIWGPGAPVSDKALNAHISRIREKIEADWRKPKYLVTHHGFGYSTQVVADP